MQLDVKLANGIPYPILTEALDKARIGRLQILGHMNTTLPTPRRSLKPSAPTAALVLFDPEKKKYLIGTGGESIRYIETTYQVKLDLHDDGQAHIYGQNRKLVKLAKELVEDLVIVVKEGDVLQSEVADIKVCKYLYMHIRVYTPIIKV